MHGLTFDSTESIDTEPFLLGNGKPSKTSLIL